MPIFSVPWGPHCGLLYTFYARPRALEGLVQCMPKALPIKEFKAEWELLDEPRQYVVKQSQTQSKLYVE